MRFVNHYNIVKPPKGIDGYRHQSDYGSAFLRSAGQRIGIMSLWAQKKIESHLPEDVFVLHSSKERCFMCLLSCWYWWQV